MEYQEISLLKSWGLGVVMSVSSLSTTNKLFSKITMLHITAKCFIHTHKYTSHTNTHVHIQHIHTHKHTPHRHKHTRAHTNCETILFFNFCEQLRHTLKVLLYFLDPLQINYILESPTF